MNNYSMPTQYCSCSKCAQPPKENKSEINAVKIELINPQAYGSAPQETCMPNPLAVPIQPVYAYPQNQIYPTSQVISEGPTYFMNQEQNPVPFIPQQPLSNKNRTTPPITPSENFVAMQTPVKKELPAALVDQNPKPSATQEVAKSIIPAKKEEKPPIDIKPIIGSLKSNDMEQEFLAIQQIAEIGQNTKIPSDLLINDEIFKGLSGIITKDTSNMPGPTAEQKQLREKKFSGTKLTPKENEIAETLAPKEIAELNKQFATYALATVQKNFRTSVNKEAEKQGLEKVKLNEIPEIDTVIENVKSNPNPLIREASLSALSYIAKAEDKETLGIIFSTAAQDKDPVVKMAAEKAQEKINKLS